MKRIPALLILIATACASSSPRSAEQAIREALQSWVEANNRGDRARANEIWAPDVTGWFPAAPAFGPQAAAEVAGASAAGNAHSTYELTIDEILVSGDLAVVRDTWRETRHFDGGRAAVRTIRSFEVWRRSTGGAWKIIRWISAPEPWGKP